MTRNPSALWAKRRALHLKKLLGMKCALCPESDPDKLQFDHPYGRDWIPRKKSRWQRITIISREILQGRVRLLCGPCNLKTREKLPSGRFAPTGKGLLVKGEKDNDVNF